MNNELREKIFSFCLTLVEINFNVNRDFIDKKTEGDKEYLELEEWILNNVNK